MTFQEALIKLNIQEYSEDIFHSNSHGELIHLDQYVYLAEGLSENSLIEFPIWFKEVDDLAKSNMKNPATWYQHVCKIFFHWLKTYNEETGSGEIIL